MLRMCVQKEFSIEKKQSSKQEIYLWQTYAGRLEVKLYIWSNDDDVSTEFHMSSLRTDISQKPFYCQRLAHFLE